MTEENHIEQEYPIQQWIPFYKDETKQVEKYFLPTLNGLIIEITTDQIFEKITGKEKMTFYELSEFLNIRYALVNEIFVRNNKYYLSKKEAIELRTDINKREFLLKEMIQQQRKKIRDLQEKYKTDLRMYKEDKRQQREKALKDKKLRHFIKEGKIKKIVNKSLSKHIIGCYINDIIFLKEQGFSLDLICLYYTVPKSTLQSCIRAHTLKQ